MATQPIHTDSLPLKLSRRTRQKSPETSQSNNETAPVEPPPSQPAQETEDGADTRERDSLDDIIDETKAVRHLVRNSQKLPDPEQHLTMTSPSIHSIPTKSPMTRKLMMNPNRRSRPTKNSIDRPGNTKWETHGRKISLACRSTSRTQSAIAQTAGPLRSCSRWWIIIHAPPINGGHWPTVRRSVHCADKPNELRHEPRLWPSLGLEPDWRTRSRKSCSPITSVV